jgi:adenylate kinase
MVIILLGPPGVGKGTQAKMLVDATGMRHVSTGDLLRAARKEGTELGRKAQAFMDAGELVPDSLIMDMVAEELDSLPSSQEIVFDGFPRTEAQAEALSPVLQSRGRVVNGVVVLEGDDEVIVRRLAGRRSCGDCGAVYNVHFTPPTAEGSCDRCGGELVQRPDDKPETVRNRLEVYRRQTEPLVRYYEASAARVWYVRGDGGMEDVHQGVIAAVVAGRATAGGGTSGP